MVCLHHKHRYKQFHSRITVLERCACIPIIHRAIRVLIIAGRSFGQKKGMRGTTLLNIFFKSKHPMRINPLTMPLPTKCCECETPKIGYCDCKTTDVLHLHCEDCGLPIAPTPTLPWEERFDKKFCSKGNYTSKSKEIPWMMGTYPAKRVKDFIRTLLTEQRERIRLEYETRATHEGALEGQDVSRKDAREP